MTEKRFDPDIEGFLGEELTNLKETEPPGPPAEAASEPNAGDLPPADVASADVASAEPEAYQQPQVTPDVEEAELEARLKWALSTPGDVEVEAQPTVDEIQQPDLFSPPPTPPPPPVVPPPAPIASSPEPAVAPIEVPPLEPSPSLPPAPVASPPPTEAPSERLAPPIEVPPPVEPPPPLPPAPLPIATPPPTTEPAPAPAPSATPPPAAGAAPAPLPVTPTQAPPRAPAASAPAVPSRAVPPAPASTPRMGADAVSILEIGTPDEGGVREVALPGNRAVSPPSPGRAKRMGWDHPASRAVVYLLIVAVLTFVFLLILINLFHLG